MDSNKSHDTSSNGGNSTSSINNNNSINNNSSHREAKRQQFTNKQRMDMYAFCVLELEMHSNKVSIKKQQQAIQKVLYEQQQKGCQKNALQIDANHQQQNPPPCLLPAPQLATQQQDQQQQQQLSQSQPLSSQPQEQSLGQPAQGQPMASSDQQQLLVVQPNQPEPGHSQSVLHNGNGEPSLPHNDSNASSNQSGVEGKTLLQLQQEVAMSRRCYSDYQKTQVLTSSMLRDVQKRFAKYYPDSAIPSRTTVKHVFEKCVAHGTVENMKTPRKATKLPQGDEIEYLLIHEPQLSLRQLAQKLNVSTGTISRRCKALGLMPESVTIKHQQLASARRQKQIKQLESQSKLQAIEPSTNGNGSQRDGSINR